MGDESSDESNDEELYNAEMEHVSLRIYELNEKPLKGNFDFKYLKNIHKYLFQDVYKWAGEIRNCNIAKQDLFCLAKHIESFGNEVFDKLKKENYFVGVKSEMSKVKWPTKQEVIKYTIATLIFIIVLVIFFVLLSLLMSFVKGAFN